MLVKGKTVFYFPSLFSTVKFVVKMCESSHAFTLIKGQGSSFSWLVPFLPSFYSLNVIPFHCQSVSAVKLFHSLAPALRLCSRVASPSAGVWCRTKHEKNVIDVSAVAVRKSSTRATDTTLGEKDTKKGRLKGWKKRGKKRGGPKGRMSSGGSIKCKKGKENVLKAVKQERLDFCIWDDKDLEVESRVTKNGPFKNAQGCSSPFWTYCII